MDTKWRLGTRLLYREDRRHYMVTTQKVGEGSMLFDRMRGPFREFLFGN